MSLGMIERGPHLNQLDPNRLMAATFAIDASVETTTMARRSKRLAAYAIPSA
jgi:hypothetical protein